jgi:hypothetical protein
MSDQKLRVKQTSSSIIGALVLLPPIILLSCLMFLPAGCGSSSTSATPVATAGLIQIGFTNAPPGGTTDATYTNFQNVLLNIISVRVNQNSNPLSTDPDWITINAPPGAGAVGELQIDLTQLQNNSKLFNTGVVKAQSYQTLQLILDSVTPAGVVPNCAPPASNPTATGVPSPTPTPGETNEGCIKYGATLNVGSVVTIDLTAAPIIVTDQGLASVVINLNVASITGPSVPGGTYNIVSSGPTILPASSNVMAVVKGSVNTTPKVNTIINAELAGTNTVITSAPVITTGCDTGADGCFTLSLPAAAASPGTAYNFFLSGGSAQFSVISVPGTDPAQYQFSLVAGQTLSLNNISLDNTNTTFGTISGAVSREAQFGGGPIQGATVELLDTTSQVALETAASDPTGFFSFTVPIAATETAYSLKISQPGFDPINSVVTLTSKSSSCEGSIDSNCDLIMTNSTITGTVSVDVVQSSDLQVMIVAEDTGTANVENFTLVTIPRNTQQAQFTMTVPTLEGSSVKSLDLVASAQDSFQGGAPGPSTGHSIAVLSGVSTGASGVTLGPLNCLGYGAIVGTLNNPQSNNTVLLTQNDPNGIPVVVSQALVGLGTGANPGPFAFCAPPNANVTYQLQRAVNGSPTGNATGVPLMNTPAPTASPCPICNNTGGICPGNCIATGVGALP